MDDSTDVPHPQDVIDTDALAGRMLAALMTMYVRARGTVMAEIGTG
ncbi:hypothetical protein [Mycobacterium sp. C31M]